MSGPTTRRESGLFSAGGARSIALVEPVAEIQKRTIERRARDTERRQIEHAVVIVREVHAELGREPVTQSRAQAELPQVVDATQQGRKDRVKTAEVAGGRGSEP